MKKKQQKMTVVYHGTSFFSMQMNTRINLKILRDLTKEENKWFAYRKITYVFVNKYTKE